MPVSHPLRMIQNNQEGTTESFLGYSERHQSLGLKELLQNAELPFSAVAELKPLY